jgi:hypothetical protein
MRTNVCSLRRTLVQKFAGVALGTGFDFIKVLWLYLK